MLDSMKATTLTNGVFVVEFPGVHKPIEVKKQSISNAEVAQYVEENGRPFIYPTDREIKKLKDNLINTFKNQLRAGLSKIK